MTTSISIFSIAPEAKPSVIGARILDIPAFLDLLKREISETATVQQFDGRENVHIQLRPEVVFLVSSGNGLRSDREEDHHVRDERRYLRRNRAFSPRGCYACVMSLEYYLELRDKHMAPGEEEWPLPPEGTTHILLGINVIDETTDRGNPPWAAIVADEA